MIAHITLMPIHFRENQYPGINAHLQSYLQNETGGWESFHADYITFLRVGLDNELPPGYVARSEMGLQISEIAPSQRQPSRSKPDIMIFQRGVTTTQGRTDGIVARPTATYAISETLEPQETLTGLVIYQTGEGTPPGRAITRIEVLSPANKPGGSHHRAYIQKRTETLRAGLRLVELDFLHESRPIIHIIPSYPDHEEGARPYSIIVSDPRPSLDQGQTALYSFEVDQILEAISIPLAGADHLAFDFGAVYDQCYASSRFFGETIDYAQFPVRFERYSTADQQRIRARMQAIAASVIG